MRLFFLTAAAACALSFVGVAGAQTTPTYKYSASLSITVPKGSSAETAAKDKTKPAAMRYTPCDEDKLDQLAINLKYDAGKIDSKAGTDQRQNVYLIFHKDGTFYPLVRQRLTSSSGFFAEAKSVAGIQETHTYTAAEDNLGGVQTEIILGGNLVLEDLPNGVWTVTAIVAGSGVNFDDPTTWSAWDTVPFMLGKPWAGITNTTCK